MALCIFWPDLVPNTFCRSSFAQFCYISGFYLCHQFCELDRTHIPRRPCYNIDTHIKNISWHLTIFSFFPLFFAWLSFLSRISFLLFWIFLLLTFLAFLLWGFWLLTKRIHSDSFTYDSISTGIFLLKQTEWAIFSQFEFGITSHTKPARCLPRNKSCDPKCVSCVLPEFFLPWHVNGRRPFPPLRTSHASLYGHKSKQDATSPDSQSGFGW